MTVAGVAKRDAAGREEYWASLALRYCRGLGLPATKKLLTHFGSALETVRNAAWWPSLGLPGRVGTEFRKEAWRVKAKEEWDDAWKSPCSLVLWTDPAYPGWLKAIDDPPLFLYCLGDTGLLSNLAVAVVGARECSMEGLRATVHIARGLSAAGVTVVSGMARGIDRAAHCASLEGPGSSIAVLGTGVDVLYPKPNLDLRTLLLEKGLLVSEFAPSLKGDGRLFPVRNRIISGLSRGVLVAEAAMRSGSLNTARHALEQGREVFAVPGPVSLASSKGCQELVRRGAKAVFSADDVLRELVPFLKEHVRRAVEKRDLERFAPKREKDGGEDLTLTPGLLPWLAEGDDAAPPFASFSGRAALEEAAQGDPPPVLPVAAEAREKPLQRPEIDVPEAAKPVLALLREKDLHIDDICRALGQNAGALSALLATLEIRGHVRRLPGMVYALARP